MLVQINFVFDFFKVQDEERFLRVAGVNYAIETAIVKIRFEGIRDVLENFSWNCGIIFT